MVEASVISGSYAPAIAILLESLMKIGITTVGERLMVGNGVYYCFEFLIIYISSISLAIACCKTCNKPSLTKIFVDTIETRNT